MAARATAGPRVVPAARAQGSADASAIDRQAAQLEASRAQPQRQGRQPQRREPGREPLHPHAEGRRWLDQQLEQGQADGAQPVT